MIEITPRLIFLIVFVGGLAAFLYWDRDKISRHYILFYRRTKRGIVFIDRIAKKSPRFWNLYGWAGVVTGFLSLGVATVLIGQSFFKMLSTKSVEQGPGLVLPGLVSQNQFQAGVSFIPVEYWVVGVGILMFVHEMSHGIVARTEGFEINSVGWIIFGILPGAFVEPKGENMLPGDESNQDDTTGMWEQGNWKSRLKVLGAGSFANYITGAIFLLLATGMTSAITGPSPVYYQADKGLPAYDSGMRNGSLVEVNDQKIESVNDLISVSNSIEVNQTVDVWTSEGNFSVKAIKKEGRDGGYIGIRVTQANTLKEPYDQYQGLLQWFTSMIFTVGLLNILIGLFNMLPIKPLDGGLMAETLIKEFAEDRMHYLHTLSLVGWALLLGSIVTAILFGAI